MGQARCRGAVTRGRLAPRSHVKAKKAGLPSCVPIWRPSGDHQEHAHTHKHEDNGVNKHTRRVEVPHCHENTF